MYFVSVFLVAFYIKACIVFRSSLLAYRSIYLNIYYRFLLKFLFVIDQKKYKQSQNQLNIVIENGE